MTFNGTWEVGESALLKFTLIVRRQQVKPQVLSINPNYFEDFKANTSAAISEGPNNQVCKILGIKIFD